MSNVSGICLFATVVTNRGAPVPPSPAPSPLSAPLCPPPPPPVIIIIKAVTSDGTVNVPEVENILVVLMASVSIDIDPV
jgi:hypothetical protein